MNRPTGETPQVPPAKKHLHLLVSSVSARGHALEVGPGVVRALRHGGWEVTVRVTTTDDDPLRVAATSGAPYVGALGGDGFVAAVAAGVHDTASVFVPFPGGRGNDLCRSLGIGVDAHARALVVAQLAAGGGTALEGRTTPLDGIWVERADGSRRLALGIVSLGLDAWANRLANETWIPSGPLAYAWGALKAAVKFRGADFRAVVDGRERDLDGLLLSVSNSGYFGGGVNIVPASDPTDGRLELLHVRKVSLLRALPALISVLAHRSTQHPLVDVIPVEAVDITAPPGMPAMADGDHIGDVPLRVRVARGVVRALV